MMKFYKIIFLFLTIIYQVSSFFSLKKSEYLCHNNDDSYRDSDDYMDITDAGYDADDEE